MFYTLLIQNEAFSCRIPESSLTLLKASEFYSKALDHCKGASFACSRSQIWRRCLLRMLSESYIAQMSSAHALGVIYGADVFCACSQSHTWRRCLVRMLSESYMAQMSSAHALRVMWRRCLLRMLSGSYMAQMSSAHARVQSQSY
jgi:hypothetical protein